MDNGDPGPEVVPKRARPTRQFPRDYKKRILAEYDRSSKAEKGALLRREGLCSSLLSEWRAEAERGADAKLAKPAGRRKAKRFSESRRSSAGAAHSAW